MMSNTQYVMRKAWRIAKNGAENYGGKVGEYISEAMKIAWTDLKKCIAKIKKANVKKIYACVVDGHKVTVERDTNSVFGNTYPIKNFLKKNYSVKWNPMENCWVFKNNDDLNAFVDTYQVYAYL